MEAEAEGGAGMEEEWWSKKRAVVCVMDSSGQLGSSLVQRLLQTGYAVHAAALHNYTPHFHGEMQFLEGEGLLCCDEEKKKKKKRLRVFHSDPLDYHSILDALKGCSALFYCFEPPPDRPIYDYARRIRNILNLYAYIMPHNPLELACMLLLPPAPPSPPPPTSSLEEKREYKQRITNKKLNKLMVDFQIGVVPS
ncbi:cinnamoyl-CoA reductase [Sarracenia purpurea var. burkii]